MNQKLKLMDKAIEIAESGRGRTSPNPFVGCVIVKDGKLIGEGVTQKCGSDHAEIQALKQAGAESNNSEMYVTLEPCCFQGRTPACTQAIIKAGVRKVYIGIKDPNPRVNGQGIIQLKAAGIEVEEGFRSAEITEQLEYYLTNMQKQRPFVILKSAITLDGYIAGADGSSKWITGEPARQKVHELRSEVDAIITGIGTILQDDPQLNNRNDGENHQPLRIVLDSSLRIPVRSKLVMSANEQKTLVFCCAAARAEKASALKELGVDVKVLKGGKLEIEAVLQELYRREISVVMLEAGEKLVSSFERAGLIDKYFIFIAPQLLGNGRQLLLLPEHGSMIERHLLQYKSVERIGEDILITAYNRR
ncbi:MAG: bifunctional diaminohydroxyphosphoribosylaminopyrimidine deaminase/5-amino-6-(5-phosphoribosylamino)uracil reductase RibD [Candidatus Cloacimonetes bacterium]|nr:bifunctional diaminohydroxyphosphoribosylaminopyrimidine deaminase/5-amino-6-(5-phosphoribosylamino)uracil reductase RibD [Candidatus Cloacimonadota bacterium]